MAEILFSSVQSTVADRADTVWQKMKHFGDLSWARGLDDVKLVTDGVSQCRKIRMAGSDIYFDETVLAFDERGRSLRYGMEDNAVEGLINYEAQAQVLARADGCIIRWQCQADAAVGKEAEVQAVLDRFASGIVQLFAAQFTPGEGA